MPSDLKDRNRRTLVILKECEAQSQGHRFKLLTWTKVQLYKCACPHQVTWLHRPPGDTVNISSSKQQTCSTDDLTARAVPQHQITHWYLGFFGLFRWVWHCNGRSELMLMLTDVLVSSDRQRKSEKQSSEPLAETAAQWNRQSPKLLMFCRLGSTWCQLRREQTLKFLWMGFCSFPV